MSKITAAESFEAEVVWLGLPRRNTIAVSIEMDRPVLSRTLHGFLLPHRAVRSFLNVGAAAACKVAAEDALDCLTTGCVSRHKVKCSVKNMFKEGAYWGAAAGAFEAIEYGVELMRGRSDWKNAMIGGAIAGALVSAANSTHRGNRSVIKDAIAGGAIGTAVEFISHRRVAEGEGEEDIEMPELAEFWVEVVWLGSRRWWPSSVTGSFAARPVLSRAAHAFRNAAVAAACKVAAEDAFHCLTTGGGVPKHKLEHSLKKICKDGAYWGNRSTE